jgi:hypothetical protein
MKRFICLTIPLTLMACSSQAPKDETLTAPPLLFAGDPCEIAVPNPRASLVLQEVRLSKDGNFEGTFELSNVGFKRTLILQGVREGAVFVVGEPEVSTESRAHFIGQICRLM